MESALQDLKTATQTISESQVESGKVSKEIISSLTNFVNQSAKAVGIENKEIQVQNLTEEEAQDQGKVYEKLDEINAKIAALKGSMETNEVVVKSWFEGT